MDEQGRYHPDAVAMVRTLNERVLHSKHLHAPPVRLAAIGCSFFPIQYRQVWQYSDSAALRATTNARREADSIARVADLADHLLRRLQTLDVSISVVPPRKAAPAPSLPPAPETGTGGGAAAAAAAAAGYSTYAMQ